MKMSEILQSYTIVAPKDADQTELRVLIKKAYQHCWANRTKQPAPTNPYLGPCVSARTLDQQHTFVYSDSAVVITYQNGGLLLGTPGATIQVQSRRGNTVIMVLNTAIDYRAQTLKVVTYKPSGLWEQHLMDL